MRSIIEFLLFASTSGNKSRADADATVDEIRARELKLLVIDDDEDYRRSFCFKLKRKYKAQVDDVNLGRLAVEKLKEGHSYDLIFTDIMMPEMSGIETYHELRKLNGTVRIVIMSAYSDSEEWKRAQQLGVTLLHKPIADHILLRVLRGES
ncbi:MAG TPA: response regulator [Pyrinomonadaceae bacterium]|nr:response regulator [Pyrinomonadaceae bacterium]